jgi:hypothetical protein
MHPREREGEEEGTDARWRHPAATLDQPAADGVVTPPRLANRRRRAASRREREGLTGGPADGWARVSKEIKKISNSNSKFKISYFLSSKNHQFPINKRPTAHLPTSSDRTSRNFSSARSDQYEDPSRAE